jgi:hypothetical protein
MLIAAKHLQYLLENKSIHILRVVYPERQSEILRCARNDSEGLRMTGSGRFSASSEGMKDRRSETVNL